MSSDKPFDDMTEDEQDEVARAKMREILTKPELTEEDAGTVAACVAFLGTSPKIADKFAQALLDAAESLTTGLCVRCGSDVGEGPVECLICQGIRNVQTLKLVKQNNHEETLELHWEYPHTFEDGRFYKFKAVNTLTGLETMVSPTVQDTEAIAHIRGHLELDDNGVVDAARDLELVAEGVIVDIDEDEEAGTATLEVKLAKPWTEEELHRLNMNKHLPVKVLTSLFKDRTPEEIQEKLEELG